MLGFIDETGRVVVGMMNGTVPRFLMKMLVVFSTSSVHSNCFAFTIAPPISEISSLITIVNFRWSTFMYCYCFI